jgi:hypothetical protein
MPIENRHEDEGQIREAVPAAGVVDAQPQKHRPSRGHHGKGVASDPLPGNGQRPQREKPGDDCDGVEPRPIQLRVILVTGEGCVRYSQHHEDAYRIEKQGYETQSRVEACEALPRSRCADSAKRCHMVILSAVIPGGFNLWPGWMEVPEGIQSFYKEHFPIRRARRPFRGGKRGYI